MLDSNKENLKLDAMKRIVGMIAKGKNASDLFPAVVKNVVSKNVEVKTEHKMLILVRLTVKLYSYDMKDKKTGLRVFDEICGRTTRFGSFEYKYISTSSQSNRRFIKLIKFVIDTDYE